MAKRTVFSDEDNNELHFYLNTLGRLFITVGKADMQDTNGYITLDKEDVKTLIKELQELVDIED